MEEQTLQEVIVSQAIKIRKLEKDLEHANMVKDLYFNETLKLNELKTNIDVGVNNEH